MMYNNSTDRAIATLQDLGDVFQDLVGLVDENGMFLFLNPAGREMVGIGDGAALEFETVQTFFPDWSVNNLISRGRVNGNVTEGPVNLTMRREAPLSTRDGRTIPTHLSVYAHLSDSYEVEFFMFVARDLSALKQIESDRLKIEERLLDACRMETIGRLSVGVAQNLENTIGQIAEHAESAFDLTEPVSAIRKPIESALRAAQSARHAVAQIVYAGSPGRDTGTPVRIKRVIREAISMAEASLPGTIVVRQHLDTTGDPIAIGPTQIREIVLNLVLNAREALELTGGVLDIKLDTINVGADAAGTRRRPHAQRYARITVSDNGPGIPDDAVSQLFASSAVRKTSLDSTRLGLSVMNRLVEECGGAVTVHNRVGRGTTFHVFLPAGSTANSLDG